MGIEMETCTKSMSGKDIRSAVEAFGDKQVVLVSIALQEDHVVGTIKFGGCDFPIIADSYTEFVKEVLALRDEMTKGSDPVADKLEVIKEYIVNNTAHTFAAIIMAYGDKIKGVKGYRETDVQEKDLDDLKAFVKTNYLKMKKE